MPRKHTVIKPAPLTPIDIDAVLEALTPPITRYGAAQLIVAETEEELSAVQMRLSRWAKGKPPNLATAISDLDAIGFRLALVAI